MIDALRNAFRLPDLRRKMLYTAMILVIYQFAAHVTVPGVDRDALDQLFSGDQAGFLNVLNLLSGGAVSNFSVIANGVYPYITASIILQCWCPSSRSSKRLPRSRAAREDQPVHLHWRSRWRRCKPSARSTSSRARSRHDADPRLRLWRRQQLADDAVGDYHHDRRNDVRDWLGELITEQGIGNGISIIIFAGIVARVPANLCSCSRRTSCSTWWRLSC